MATNYSRAARTNPHKVHIHTMVRGRVVKGSGDALVSNPLKSDYPETTLEHDDLMADMSAVAPNIPARIPRSRPWAHVDTIVSARSKRELRKLIQAQNAGAGHLVISNIQINDQGKYFVYTNPGGAALRVAPSLCDGPPGATTAGDCQ